MSDTAYLICLRYLFKSHKFDFFFNQKYLLFFMRAQVCSELPSNLTILDNPREGGWMFVIAFSVLIEENSLDTL